MSSTSVAGIRAPVGQACTHSPQATQVEAPIGIVEIEDDFFAVAAPGHADDIVDLDFTAGAYAQIALNAGVEIDRHGGMAAVGLGMVPIRETAPADTAHRSAHDQNFDTGSCAAMVRSG